MPPELTWPLPCVVCGRKPKPVFDAPMSDDEPNWQPYGATAFTSHGQYGSTVFDEMGDRQYLLINVCDHCMRAKAQENVIALAHRIKPPREPVDYEPWRPYEPEDDSVDMSILHYKRDGGRGNACGRAGFSTDRVEGATCGECRERVYGTPEDDHDA